MSFPFQPLSHEQSLTFEGMLGLLRRQATLFPDKRRGTNCSFPDMADVVLSGFSIFYLQSPSFLAHQQQMEIDHGQNNARSLFGIEKIPTPNHVRSLLDGASPTLLHPVYQGIAESLYQRGLLEKMRGFNRQMLIAMDGVHFHESDKVHCDQCSRKQMKNGDIKYFHSAVTPVIVSPHHKCAISLCPEFVAPQDGHQKQDCEQAAAHRWLTQHGARYRSWEATLLGDDLYCHQPFCEKAQAEGYHFLLVCKPDSHKTLYEWLAGLEKSGWIQTKIVERKIGKRREIDTYRFANHLPLRDSEDALKVNWCEMTTTTPEGKVVYRNTFATDHPIHEHNVADMVAAGRSRWKIENENNNTLKTKGYHFEHNFGHGKESLANLLASMNMLAFLFHTVLDWTCEVYAKLRAKLGARKKFFEHVRTLTQYICFKNWAGLLHFMAEQLKVKIIIDPSG